VFESFERENGRVIVFPSSVVGSDNASAVSEKWRDQKMSQKFAPEVGTSLRFCGARPVREVLLDLDLDLARHKKVWPSTTLETKGKKIVFLQTH
jgi:hypothetical protein